MKNTFMIRSLVTLVGVLAIAIPVLAQETVEHYPARHIKEHFCGVHISFMYCKCAFHNDYCEDVKMDQDSAHKHVYEKFTKWVNYDMKIFAIDCMNKGGIWNQPSKSCVMCDEGYLREKARCIEPGNKQDIVGLYKLPKADWVEKPSKHEFAGRISASDAEVFVYMSAFQKWTGPVKGGQPIYKGDLVYTTGRGKAQVILHGAELSSIVDVAPNSLMHLPPPPQAPAILGSLLNGWCH